MEVKDLRINLVVKYWDQREGDRPRLMHGVIRAFNPATGWTRVYRPDARLPMRTITADRLIPGDATED